MAQLDITELLSDPDFVDAISLITRTPTIDSKGENSLSESSLNSIGSVQPADVRTVMKLPEEFRVANLCSFWYKGKIIASEAGKYSSILVFKGQRYQVQTVADWTNWGAGWSEGTCIQEAPAE